MILRCADRARAPRPLQRVKLKPASSEPRHDALSPEIDDHLDVAFAVLERLTPVLKGDRARDQPPEPMLIGTRKRVCGHLVMPTVRVDCAEHDVVLEHHASIEAADIQVEYLSR